MQTRQRKKQQEGTGAGAAQGNGTPASSTALKRDPSLDRVDRGRLRSGLEIPRKLLHSSIAYVVLQIWLAHPSVPFVIKCAAIALGIIVGADVLRFQSPTFERTYENYLGFFMREEERHRVNGTIYYLVGVLICLCFYPRDIAVLSIVILSLCDTSASVFGRLFGRYTWPLPFRGTLFGAKKSSAGTIAAILTGTLASYIFWSSYASLGSEGDLSWIPGELASKWKRPATPKPIAWLPRLPNPKSTMSLLVLSASHGLVAGVAEAIDVFGMDDNLSLPVLFGFFAWAVMWIAA